MPSRYATRHYGEVQWYTILLLGLLNGENDVVDVDVNLLLAYGVSVSYVDRDGGETREVTFMGEASPQAYEEVKWLTVALSAVEPPKNVENI